MENKARDNLLKKMHEIKSLTHASDDLGWDQQWCVFSTLLAYLEEFSQEAPSAAKLKTLKEKSIISLRAPVLHKFESSDIPTIRAALHELHGLAFGGMFYHDGPIDNSVLRNLRLVGDNPVRIFEMIVAYLAEMVLEDPCEGYLNGKKERIIEWMDEIERFGFKINMEATI